VVGQGDEVEALRPGVPDQVLDRPAPVGVIRVQVQVAPQPALPGGGPLGAGAAGDTWPVGDGGPAGPGPGRRLGEGDDLEVVLDAPGV
jgi:hypothetical protein